MALTATHLRVESPNGVSEEYRICDGYIEVRHLQRNSTEYDQWHRLNPKQVADHVNRNTVVAQWLMRRLGWRRLLRACVTEESVRHLDMLDIPADRRVA